MEDIIQLNQDYQILICRLCQAAVRPGSSIETHFRQKHLLKGQVLKDIKDYYGTLELADPKLAATPEDNSEAIEQLVISHGYSCNACRYLTIARDNIVRHWREAGHGAAEERWTEVRLQTWMGGHYARYWIVRDDSDSNGPSDTADEANARSQSAMDEVIAASEARLKEKDAARLRKGDLKEDIDRDSSWVKRVGWVRHFGSRDLTSIHDAAEWLRARAATGRRTVAQDDEEAVRERLLLGRLGQSFDREVERCCWRLDSVPTETLQWLASISSTTPSGQPFGRKGKEASMIKYKSVGHRYLGFCWKAYRIGRKEALERWAVRFTDEQWSLLQDIADELERDRVPSSHDSGFFSGRERQATDKDEDEYQDDDNSDEDERGSEGMTSSLDGALDRAVFNFIVASIKTHVGGNVYTNSLLCFCAALGINRHPLGYLEPHLYTGMLAGILWWARLFFLEAVFENQPVDQDEVGIEAVLTFREEHTSWMCIGTHSVISTIIGWMAYGKGYRQKNGGQPSIRWSDDEEGLFHMGEHISVEDFTRTLRDEVTEAEKLLNGLFGGVWQTVSKKIDMGRIVDNMIRLGAGQSFASNPKNKWLEAGPAKVMRLMEASIWDAARVRWKRQRVKRWLRDLRLLRETLLVLVHTWGGLPGRGPEITTLRHCDSWQLIRNVFILDGQVMIVTDRDKMKAIRDNGRKVARFIPDRIGRMVVAYIAWLLPTERVLRQECQLNEPHGEQLEYMWRDGSSSVWETDRLSKKLARVMQAGTGVRLGVGRYRAIAIEMGRRIRGLVIRQLEGKMDEDEDENVEIDPITGEPVDCGGSWNIVWDLQSTHGTRIARQHYAVHIGFPGKLQPEMIATFKEISKLWHQFLESAEEGKEKKVPKRKQGSQKTDKQQQQQEQQQSTNSPAQMTTSSKRRKTTQEEELAQKKKEMSEKKKKKLEDEMADGLRKLLGPKATWRSDKQAESMRSIMALKADQTAINVLPTGAGKSILFMLPAVMEDTGTSIVVVPFVALMDDLVTRATDMGVDCIRYRSSMNSGREGMPRAARLIVVSADIVSSAEFSGYVDGLSCTGLLQRIFVDECHTVIMDIGYRAKLGELVGLRRFGCPLVLLTATLPVVLEDWFRGEMLAKSAIMVRDRTVKLNCRYEVQQVKPGRDAVEDRTVEVIKQLDQDMTGRQKGVIYCRSKSQCEAIADEIGCGFHHSGMSEQDRYEVRTAWIEGRNTSRWIAATTGLGTGIDIEGIVAVVHMEKPYGLVDFVQQIGRGGRRAGEVVRSVIIHNGQRQREDQHRSFVDDINQAQMEAFVSTPGCRRAVISAFMDGAAGETCEDVDGATLCDRCELLRRDDDYDEGEGRIEEVIEESEGETEEKTEEETEGESQGEGETDGETEGETEGETNRKISQGSESESESESDEIRKGGRIWKAFGKEEGMRIKTLFRWLDDVAEECPICHVRRHQKGQELGEVPDQPRHKKAGQWCATVAEEGYDIARREIRFKELSCCFVCKLPLNWCEETQDEEGRCAYKDKLLPVVLMGLRSWRVRDIVRAELGVDVEDRKAFYRWLGVERRFHGMKGTNAHAVWEAVIWEIYKNKK
ncbi:hypothetical protein IWW34DRAFT_737753 [Fusarium oxysporum f. sp. albedinis]|nr:hypothetical protein IWW34DRAFT_737753 [Fusarium oxysporum f. sp. albedinis]